MQKYKIYRGLVTTAGVEPTLSYIGETTDTTYYDAAIDLYDRGGGTGACTYLFKKYTYRVTAFDSTSKESVRSERDSVEGYEDPCAPEESIENIYNPEIRLDYELSQNFPNPFNPITEIRYSFPEVGFVSLKIYDLSGKEVKVLVDEYKQPGQYNIAFDASTLPSGVYFYRIKVNNYSFVRKMLLIK